MRAYIDARDGSHGFSLFGIPCRAPCGCRAADTVGGVGPTLANGLRQAPTSTLRHAHGVAHVSFRPATARTGSLLRRCLPIEASSVPLLRSLARTPRQHILDRSVLAVTPAAANRSTAPCRHRQICCRCHRLRGGHAPAWSFFRRLARCCLVNSPAPTSHARLERAPERAASMRPVARAQALALTPPHCSLPHALASCRLV